jgi:hypothetical protein
MAEGGHQPRQLPLLKPSRHERIAAVALLPLSIAAIGLSLLLYGKTLISVTEQIPHPLYYARNM